MTIRGKIERCERRQRDRKKKERKKKMELSKLQRSIVLLAIIVRQKINRLSLTLGFIIVVTINPAVTFYSRDELACLLASLRAC